MESCCGYSYAYFIYYELTNWRSSAAAISVQMLITRLHHSSCMSTSQYNTSLYSSQKDEEQYRPANNNRKGRCYNAKFITLLSG